MFHCIVKAAEICLRYPVSALPVLSFMYVLSSTKRPYVATLATPDELQMSASELLTLAEAVIYRTIDILH